MNEPAPPSERRGRAAAAFVAVAAWLAFGAFSLLPYRPPAAVSGISPRLLAADVAALAEAPRPTATAAAAEARRYLVRRLRAGGLAPQLQEIPGRTGEAAGSGAVNVLARLPGTGDGAALLFSAHYDSVPGSPGAADDAAAVAALLQVASRLAAAPPRRNDLIFLFSDGEEEGLTGARAFAGLHPWAEDVRLVANFDALGSRGPSLLFRTAGAAAPALAALATGPRPAGSSLGEEMFRHLGHRTDLDALAALRAPAPPVPALDFALVLGSSTYHRPGDVPAALDLRSALHHASHALVLATALGDAELPPVGGPEPPPAARRVYFNLPPGLLIHYPATRALLLASGILLGVVLLAGALVRRGRARPGRMLADALRVPVDALAGAGLLAVVHGAIFSGGGGPAGEPWQGLYLGSLGLVAVAAVVVLHAGDSARQAPGDGALAGPALAWGLAAGAAAAT
ncbi:MAG TPA: M20/M25/M40 family metallo-hydrolase, partial [Thermoanaerobaculia bacterium]|nr:M20/M25/M40 family metallo-hydrolase [Thermoanaerobaculia bacterium]